MSDYNQKNNRAVWFDIPVADLERSTKFYANVLAVKVDQHSFDDFKFSVLEHTNGNGGCLVPNAGDISQKGIMLYLNVDGRIKDAVKQVQKSGGSITEDVHSIGPHGFRAIIVDSEGNRIVLHSLTDA